MDINPPSKAGYDNRYFLNPSPYSLTFYDLPSLFAGKILCRGWKNRIKGKGLNDYVFYLQKGASVYLENLKQKLMQSGVLKEDDML